MPQHLLSSPIQNFFHIFLSLAYMVEKRMCGSTIRCFTWVVAPATMDTGNPNSIRAGVQVLGAKFLVKSLEILPLLPLPPKAANLRGGLTLPREVCFLKARPFKNASYKDPIIDKKN